jgi:ribosomal protein S28E/S33
MLINKIFHLHQPVTEARERLRQMATWNGLGDAEVHCSTIEPEGVGHFEMTGASGQRVSADIQELPGEDPNRILFRSVRGNVELAGMIELFEIRPNLTEAVLTLDYETMTPLQKVFEALDRLLNRQLARIEGCVERALYVREAEGASALSGRFA